jgi:hypothetical protein
VSVPTICKKEKVSVPTICNLSGHFRCKQWLTMLALPMPGRAAIQLNVMVVSILSEPAQHGRPSTLCAGSPPSPGFGEPRETGAAIDGGGTQNGQLTPAET